jgi:hypothetical protein
MYDGAGFADRARNGGPNCRHDRPILDGLSVAHPAAPLKQDTDLDGTQLISMPWLGPDHGPYWVRNGHAQRNA